MELEEDWDGNGGKSCDRKVWEDAVEFFKSVLMSVNEKAL